MRADRKIPFSTLHSIRLSVPNPIVGSLESPHSHIRGRSLSAFNASPIITMILRNGGRESQSHLNIVRDRYLLRCYRSPRGKTNPLRARFEHDFVEFFSAPKYVFSNTDTVSKEVGSRAALNNIL